MNELEAVKRQTKVLDWMLETLEPEVDTATSEAKKTVKEVKRLIYHLKGVVKYTEKLQ